jgi:hypothetical protein
MRRTVAALFGMAVALTLLSGWTWASTLPPGSEGSNDTGTSNSSAPSSALASDATPTVEWVVHRSEEEIDGNGAVGSDSPFELSINRANLTHVEFLLSWTNGNDPLAEPDTYELSASDPTGALVPGSPARSDSDVIILRSAPLNPSPTESTDGNGSANGTVAPADAAAGGTLGEGVWRVDVTLLRSGSASTDAVEPSEHAFILTVISEWYEASPVHSVTLVPKTLSAAWDGWLPASSWEYATYGLGGASAVLGTVLAWDVRRHRSRVATRKAGRAPAIPRPPGPSEGRLSPPSARGPPPPR